MQVVFHKKIQKFIKNQKDKEIVNKIQKAIDFIINDPFIGKTLEHPFRKYKIQTIKFVYKKINYRIAYTINKDKLVFLLIDSRENFYEKLEKMIK